MTSPERWEISQLIKSGVLDPSEYPGFNDDEGTYADMDDEVGVDLDCAQKPCILREMSLGGNAARLAFAGS